MLIKNAHWVEGAPGMPAPPPASTRQNCRRLIAGEPETATSLFHEANSMRELHIPRRLDAGVGIGVIREEQV